MDADTDLTIPYPPERYTDMLRDGWRAGWLRVRLLTPEERAAHPGFAAMIPADDGAYILLGDDLIAEWDQQEALRPIPHE